MIRIEVDSREAAALHPEAFKAAFAAAMRKAGATALRDMRSEARKRIRERKRIKAGVIAKAFRMRRPSGREVDGGDWALDVKGGRRIALTAFPHRQTAKGVSVEVNRGKRTLIKGAFLATMKSGHRGVYVREGTARLPIRELLGSRPVDALLHKGEPEAVQERGRASFVATFDRLLPLELEKSAAQGRQRATWAKGRGGR